MSHVRKKRDSVSPLSEHTVCSISFRITFTSNHVLDHCAVCVYCTVYVHVHKGLFFKSIPLMLCSVPHQASDSEAVSTCSAAAVFLSFFYMQPFSVILEWSCWLDEGNLSIPKMDNVSQKQYQEKQMQFITHPITSCTLPLYCMDLWLCRYTSLFSRITIVLKSVCLSWDVMLLSIITSQAWWEIKLSMKKVY